MYPNFLRISLNSWRVQSWPLRIMRLWLGFTWIYAGLNKASDPGFLTPGSSTFIGTQLRGYSTQSPIGFAFNRLIENSLQVGIFVMLSELAIGLATIFWVAPTMAAFGGFSMSVGLWLTSSFHANPYFLASDTAYAILWLSYLLSIRNKRKGFGLSLQRRGLMRVGVIGALAVVVAGVGKFFNPPPLAKTKIIELSSLEIGATMQFVQASGAPAVLFRTNTGVFAYSAICTHQGCTVEFVDVSQTLICPCHNSEFDPFDSAKVLTGPALRPLPTVKVAIEGAWVILA